MTVSVDLHSVAFKETLSDQASFKRKRSEESRFFFETVLTYYKFTVHVFYILEYFQILPTKEISITLNFLVQLKTMHQWICTLYIFLLFRGNSL